MKVAHLTSVHDWRDPRITAKMLMSIQKAGHEAVLVTVGEAPETYNGIQIVSAGLRRGRLSNARRVVSTALALKADIYHVHDPELLIPSRSLMSTGTKIVYDIHEDYFSKGPLLGRVIRLVERWAFRWVDAVVAAEASYSRFIPGNVLQAEILNYHLPDDSDPTKPRLAPTGPVHVVYTGVVSMLRGLQTILQLGRLASESKVPLRITLCGICHHRHEREQAEAFIRENELETIVTLIGWSEYASREQIRSVQRSGDIGLCVLRRHMNYMSTIPTKFYEYMNQGLPFICSDFSGWTQFVHDNNCGLVCDPEDASQLLDTILDLQSRPEEYCDISASALQNSHRYTWDLMEARLLQLYDRLMAIG